MFLFGGYYGFGLDITYLLVIIGMVLCLGASALVNSTMNKYSKIRNMYGMSGAEAARRILDAEGLSHVKVEAISSGDHYDPSAQAVRLSSGNYHGATVTAIAVAAHECGHAIQHAKGYAPLKFRSSLVPVANIGSRLGMPIILIGILLSWNQTLIQIGIIAFSLAVLFQLVTLPVEFNASSRALVIIGQRGMLTQEEIKGGKKVLQAAALTYVAAAASSILQLLRLILLFGGNRRRSN